MSTNKEKVSWLTGLLTGWGIKESWAKVIAGAVIGALVAAGILTQPGCAHSVDVSPNRTEVCKDGSCLVIEQGLFKASRPCTTILKTAGDSITANRPKTIMALPAFANCYT